MNKGLSVIANCNDLKLTMKKQPHSFRQITVLSIQIFINKFIYKLLLLKTVTMIKKPIFLVLVIIAVILPMHF